MKEAQLFSKSRPLWLVIFLALPLRLLADTSDNYLQQVLIYSQPDSPLRILNVNSRWNKMSGEVESNMLELDIAIENVSGKAIRAYAIRVFEGEPNKREGSLLLGNATTEVASIQSSQIRIEEMRGLGYFEMPRILKIAIDFVEFVDGSTWGQDVFESAQRLAGQREGAKLFLDHLRKIKEKSGIKAVIKAVEETSEVAPPENHIEMWRIGFETGVNSIRSRIQEAYKTGGLAAADATLQKTYDIASEH